MGMVKSKMTEVVTKSKAKMESLFFFFMVANGVTRRAW